MGRLESVDLQTGILTLLVLLSYILSYTLKSRNITLLPPSGAVILLGIVAGGVLKVVAPSTSSSLTQFDPSVFLTALLPPLIFESGFSVHHKRFFTNLGSIAAYAIPGTVISAAGIGLFTYAASLGLKSDHHLSLVEGLLTGALLSATDPVSTLAIFAQLGADPTTDALVFGESVMNDAVAIVLFSALLGYVNDPVTGSTLALAALQFVFVLAGSVLFGGAAAMATSALTKWAALYKFPTYEIMVLLLAAFSTYLFAVSIHLSGITAVFAFGASIRHYAWHNMSRAGQDGAIATFRSLAELAETVIFSYLGLSVFSFDGQYAPFFILVVFLACLVSRALAVVPLSLALNLGRKKKITPSMQLVLWAAGLRGAVSYALALSIPTKARDLLVATTHGVVLATIFCGGIMGPLLKVLDLTADPETTRRDSDSASRHTLELVDVTAQSLPPTSRQRLFQTDSSIRSRSKRYRSAAAECWRSLDKRVIVPLLSNKHVPHAPCHHVQFTRDLDLIPESLDPQAAANQPLIAQADPNTDYIAPDLTSPLSFLAPEHDDNNNNASASSSSSSSSLSLEPLGRTDPDQEDPMAYVAVEDDAAFDAALSGVPTDFYSPPKF